MFPRRSLGISFYTTHLDAQLLHNSAQGVRWQGHRDRFLARNDLCQFGVKPLLADFDAPEFV
jgi:hypothetical protein